MALTDIQIRGLKPTDRPYKVFDEKGLFLLIHPSGGRYWRLKYRFQGQEKTLALGVYPEVSLKDARRKRDEARAQLAQGIDPAAARREAEERQASTFRAVAQEWIERYLATKAESHRIRVIRRLEREVYPYLGDRPIAEITAPEILAILRRIEDRGVPETAHRVKQVIGQVMRFGVATGRCQLDPTASLKGALAPVPTHHMAAPTDSPQRVGELLRMTWGYGGSPIVAAALKLLPYLFVRPGELRHMRWREIDWERAEWRFTASKTKIEHLVPLSRQALAILRDLYPLTGHSEWVFPCARTDDRPMSGAALNAALRRMGIDTRAELTGHGWRAVARTFLHERLGYTPEIIECQLAHTPADPLRRAYNRAQFIAERRKMMQRWADWLDGLRQAKTSTVASIIVYKAR